jgi:hypothetical protein
MHRIAIISLARVSGFISCIWSGGMVAIYAKTAESYDWLIASFMFAWNGLVSWLIMVFVLWFMYAYLVFDPPPNPTPPPPHIPPPGSSYRSADGRMWQQVGGADATQALEY